MSTSNDWGDAKMDYAAHASKIFDSIKQCLAQPYPAFYDAFQLLNKATDYHTYQLWNAATKRYHTMLILVQSHKLIEGVPLVLVHSSDVDETDMTMTLFVELLNRFCFNTLGEVYVGVSVSKALPNVKLVQVEGHELQPFVEADVKVFPNYSYDTPYDKQCYHIFKSWLSKPTLSEKETAQGCVVSSSDDKMQARFTKLAEQSKAVCARIADDLFMCVKHCVAYKENRNLTYFVWDCETKDYYDVDFQVSDCSAIGINVPLILVDASNSDIGAVLTIYTQLLNRCFNELGEVYIAVFSEKELSDVKLVQLDTDELKRFTNSCVKVFPTAYETLYDKQCYHIFKSWLSKTKA